MAHPAAKIREETSPDRRGPIRGTYVVIVALQATCIGTVGAMAGRALRELHLLKLGPMHSAGGVMSNGIHLRDATAARLYRLAGQDMAVAAIIDRWQSEVGRMIELRELFVPKRLRRDFPRAGQRPRRR